MKFCSECGTKFAGSAKFCGECGKPRTDTVQIDSVSTSGQGLNWESFVKTYKPKKNQFAEINETFDGYFFPSWGSVGDWISFEELECVWSIQAKDDDLQSLKCKSGHWSGPNIVGYFFCDVSVPESDDLEFSLPESYCNFRGFVLKRDAETKKWRPCEYRLIGDSSATIHMDAITANRSEDELHRDLAEASKFLRASSQVMARITLVDADKRDSLAERLDARYFMLVSSPVWGWTEYYVDYYEPLESYLHLGEMVDDYEHLIMFNVPHADYHSETVSRCSICDSEDEDGEYSDHTCMDGDVGDETYASFNTSSKFQYFQANIPLAGIQVDEPGFRSQVLKYIHREFLAENISGFDYEEREPSEMASEPFQLAARNQDFSFEKLTKACTNCFKYNPQTAQVCYNCCGPFVGTVQGQIFAAIVKEFEGDEVEEMDSEVFSAWADIYYFVAQKPDVVAFVSPPVVDSKQLVQSLTARIAPLIGVEGFFNFVIQVGNREWNFSGSATGDNDEFQVVLAGRHISATTIDALENCGWAKSVSQEVTVLEKWHPFASGDDCEDAIRLGLGWLQLLSGAKPETWSTKLEVHFGA